MGWQVADPGPIARRRHKSLNGFPVGVTGWTGTATGRAASLRENTRARSRLGALQRGRPARRLRNFGTVISIDVAAETRGHLSRYLAVVTVRRVEDIA